MKLQIAVLPGDGIGPEVTEQAIKVLKAIAFNYNHKFNFTYADVGAIAIDKFNNPLPDITLNICMDSDAILFGAIGDPKYDNDPTLKVRPEQGLLKLRKEEIAIGLNELKLKKNFKPDIIYIDYLNICASSRMRGLGGSINSYSYIKAIAEEMRGLAVEFNVPIVSATQTTRSGFSNTDVGLEDTSESFGLPATADLMFALISTEELDDLGQILVKQLKNRYNDPTKYKRFVIGIDRSRMKLYDVEESAQSDIMTEMVPDKPINKFGERESNDSFADFKL